MAKQININYNGKTYNLEFTRNTVRVLEKSGFILKDISEKPVSSIPTLFAGAFLANHKKVDQSIIEEIFNKINDKDSLLEKLLDLYREPLEDMFDESSEGEVSWEASF